VAITIIGILVAVVLPSARVIQRSQDRSTCFSNLKLIGQALALYREDYQGFPADRSEGGLGLFALHYLYAYARAAPPGQTEPLRDRPEFRGGDYLRNLRTLHCPANPQDTAFRLDWPYCGDPTASPYRAYNSYDLFYRRDQGDLNGDGIADVNLGQRRLKDYPDDPRPRVGAYPPGDTVVTWCIFHRTGPAYQLDPATGRVIDTSQVRPGDFDPVLFLDGYVKRVASPHPPQYGAWLMYMYETGD